VKCKICDSAIVPVVAMDEPAVLVTLSLIDAINYIALTTAG